MEETHSIEEIKTMFNSNKPVEQKETDTIVQEMFHEAVKATVANDESLKGKVVDTAKKFTETKMQTIATNVDTEYKEAVFNNSRDACECFGSNEKTSPIYAVKMMTFFYNILLAIWIFCGAFTFMPVIFIFKRIQVGLKKTWLALVFAIIIYMLVVFVVPYATIWRAKIK